MAVDLADAENDSNRHTGAAVIFQKAGQSALIGQRQGIIHSGTSKAGRLTISIRSRLTEFGSRAKIVRYPGLPGHFLTCL
jgi:hypothetical protein